MNQQKNEFVFLQFIPHLEGLLKIIASALHFFVSLLRVCGSRCPPEDLLGNAASSTVFDAVSLPREARHALWFFSLKRHYSFECQ